MPELNTSDKRRHAATLLALLGIMLLIPLLAPANPVAYGLTIVMIVLIVVAAQLIFQYVQKWIDR